MSPTFGKKTSQVFSHVDREENISSREEPTKITFINSEDMRIKFMKHSVLNIENLAYERQHTDQIKSMFIDERFPEPSESTMMSPMKIGPRFSLLSTD